MKVPVILALLCTPAIAQQPQIENAKIETRAFAGSIESQLRQFGSGPLWAGYSEPMIAGRRGDMCWSNGNGNDQQPHATDAPVRLEGGTSLVVLIRIENGVVDQLRVTSPDCRLDAGSLPFYWLTGSESGSQCDLAENAGQRGARRSCDLPDRHPCGCRRRPRPRRSDLQ